MGRPSSQLHQLAGATILKVWMHDFTLRNLPEILALGPMDADGKNIHWATGEKIAGMSAYGPKRTSLAAPHMSAFGGKADMQIAPRNVRL
jgi:hypothetical protein